MKPGGAYPVGALPVTDLDLGCGRSPRPGAIGVDAVPLPGVRVVARIGSASLPFRDGCAQTVYALNVLEHLDDLAATMSEIWRVLASGGRCAVEVPYFASPSAHADPTHRRTFTYTTFEHFGAPVGTGWRSNRHIWFSAARFSVCRRRLRFGRLHRALGVELLANHFPSFYENLFVYWFPARSLEVVLSKLAAA